jgi:hypothetical protein
VCTGGVGLVRKIMNSMVKIIISLILFCLAKVFGIGCTSIVTAYFQTKDGFFIIYCFSIICFFLAIFSLRKNEEDLSFLFMYFSINSAYFYILFKFNFWPILLVYTYYLLVFIVYHCYFTFTKRFFCRTLVVIKGYLTQLEFLKLSLWVLLVFLPSIFNNIFIITLWYNPLLIFAAFRGNIILLSFLLSLWLWLFFLFISNKFNLFPMLLKRITKYFSRQACLHFLGNNLGTKVPQKLGTYIIYPLVAAFPAAVGLVIDADYKAAHAGLEQKKVYIQKYPDSDLYQRHQAYVEGYNDQLNSHIVGRNLGKWGVVGPGTIEGCNPNNPELRHLQNELQKIQNKEFKP